MERRLDRLRNELRNDGLDVHSFILIGYVLVWDAPELGYSRVMQEYADFVQDAPERVHADLCRRLLAAGKEIQPEKYFRLLEGRLKSEDGISVAEGS